MRRLIKGNEAVVHAAIKAGCRAYFGYPITPASEIAEFASVLLPQVGGVFIQAESEVGAIHMLYGAVSAGVRGMTASSGPGISLMQEGISYLAGSELPCVIVDIMRGGPGLGNIGPEQGDYFQMVKGGGHGNYRTLVFAPNSVQEMYDLTIHAFEVADRYRNPVVVLADGALAQMMEAVEFTATASPEPEKPWAVTGEASTRKNLIKSIELQFEAMEEYIARLNRKYKLAQERECLWEEYHAEDAEIVLVGYGIASRIARAGVELARERGIRAGLLRPISLFPFPSEQLRKRSKGAGALVVVELSCGQLIEDVRLAVGDSIPVELLYRTGGMLPTAEDILTAAERLESRHVGR